MAQVTVKIDGKSYRMACEEGQEDHLNELASKFDRYVSHLRDQFGEIGDLRLTVMAGIMVMDELSDVQGKLKGAQSELDLVKSTRDKVLQDAERTDGDMAKALGGVAQQISSIAQKLNDSN
jgi:cell division protein ZapA